MVLILLGILAAVAVPKYFDLQEESRIRAANAAIDEAQARINAYFGQLLLEGRSCEDAVKGVNADLARDSGHIADSTDRNGKVFGDFTLKIGELLPNGTATLVTAYFDGTALSGGPHGSLVVAQCTADTDAATALKMFASIGTTGNASKGGLGVIGSYQQSNSAANPAVIAKAQESFTAFIKALGWEGGTEEVGYWRLLQNDSETNVFWTDYQIEDRKKVRVPFIQARQLPDGTTTYSVGLVGVVSIGGKGAMLLRDTGNGTPFATPYGTYDTSNGYGSETNGYYVTGSASEGYHLDSKPTTFASYEEALKAYQALDAAYSVNAALVNSADDLNGTAITASASA